MTDLIVIGGGLAGSEAAWQAAQQGLQVDLYEMRPVVMTGAHTGSWLAELVCSNSLGSSAPDRAGGLLKEEIRYMGSMLLDCAEKTSVPAGSSLAVDRQAFASLVTETIASHPNIRIIREELKTIPSTLTIVATGPLTTPGLSAAIEELTGQEHLFFFDAIAPIVAADTIDMSVSFFASRYGKGEEPSGDYINCPLNKDQYVAFVRALVKAERIELREFEAVMASGVNAGVHRFFEGCLPVEILASRDDAALAFGPMRPVGIINPKTGRRPHAVVQLRRDNQAASLFNMVGFQTNLKYQEQRRIFRMIPGLENAEFERFGQMHRNTFIYSPAHLHPTLQFKGREDLFFAGQITGVEGYVGNIATGLLAGLNAARLVQGKPLALLPDTTMLGSLCRYITRANPADFQPMKANFGLLPPLDDQGIRGKRARGAAYSHRAIQDLMRYWADDP